jgi:hypothetical protein
MGGVVSLDGGDEDQLAARFPQDAGLGGSDEALVGRVDPDENAVEDGPTGR